MGGSIAFHLRRRISRYSQASGFALEIRTIPHTAQNLVLHFAPEFKRPMVDNSGQPTTPPPAPAPPADINSLGFRVVWNDGSIVNTMLLFGFKKVVSQQLPEMPIEYIFRVLMDRYHRCVLAIDLPKDYDVSKSKKKKIFSDFFVGS
jgi:hypothetical protein